MRIFALVMIAVTSALIGQYIAFVLKMRVLLLEIIEQMFSLIRNEINYLSLPANEILDKLSEIEKERYVINLSKRYNELKEQFLKNGM